MYAYLYNRLALGLKIRKYENVNSILKYSVYAFLLCSM